MNHFKRSEASISKRSGMLMTLLAIFFMIGFVLFSGFFAGLGKPQRKTTVWYTAPTWLSNDRILCAKHVEHLKLHYGWLANVSGGTTSTLKSEIQLVSMKLDGTDEQIIKNIIITPQRNKPSVSSEGDLIGAAYIRAIDYNPVRKLIAFSEQAERLYLMNADGTQLRKLAESAGGPRFSPDGRYLQYTANGHVWLYDLDTSQHKALIENAIGGPWSPDGKKIAFSRQGVFTYDLETGHEELVDSNWSYVDDWAPNGQLIIRSPLNYPRVSPDGTKLVGEFHKYDEQRSAMVYLGVTDINGQNLRVLK